MGWLSRFLLKKFLATLMLFSVIFASPFLLFLWMFSQPDPKDPRNWAITDIAKYLEVSFPADAKDVQYKVGPMRGFFINLNFKAPPQSALAFAKAVCGAALYEGYNPFTAKDSYEPSPGMYLIKDRQGFYSYSPNTPKAVWGQICDSGYRQILVDKADPKLYEVRFELTSSCYDQHCRSIYPSFVFPIAQLPLQVTGLNQLPLNTDEAHQLILQEMCLEILNVLPESWTRLIGAHFQISIDDRPMPAAFVSERGYLIPQTDRQGNPITDKRGPFSYCLTEDWPHGLHTMKIQVTTKAGDQPSYSWKFRVDKR